MSCSCLKNSDIRIRARRKNKKYCVFKSYSINIIKTQTLPFFEWHFNVILVIQYINSILTYNDTSCISEFTIVELNFYILKTLLSTSKEACPNRKHLLHWSRDRILGDISKRMLKIKIELGILVARNFYLTIRVGMNMPSFLTTMRSKTKTEMVLLKPSQKSSSGNEVSNLIIPWEKTSVNRI